MVERMKSSIEDGLDMGTLNKMKESLEKQQDSIVKAVENFDVRTLSKKAQSYLKEKNYVKNNKLDISVWGTWIKFDTKWNLCFGKAFNIPKNQIKSMLVNWRLDMNKFKNFMGYNFDKWADAYYNKKSKDAVNQLPRVTTGTLLTVSSMISKVEGVFKDIRNAWATVPAADKQTLDNKKYQYNACKDYKEVSEALDETYTNYEKMLDKKLTPREMKNMKQEIRNRLDWAERKVYLKGGKNVYQVYKKIANWEKKYNDFVSRIRKLYNTINF